MDSLDDMGVSKLSAKVFFFKVNYSFLVLSWSAMSVYFQMHLIILNLILNINIYIYPTSPLSFTVSSFLSGLL